MFSFLPHLIGGAVGSQFILAPAIILSTFILEDATTIIVGVLAADGTIGLTTALSALYIGIVGGDLACYWLGRYASTHPRLGRYVDHGLVAPIRSWIENRKLLAIFSARFIPGLRIPTFIASGYFGCSPGSFAITTIVATGIWTSMLFSAAYWFGNATDAWLAPMRWGAALAILVVFFGVGCYNLLTYQKKKLVRRA